MKEPTPELVEWLKPCEVFVFGSNCAGRHGKGAAKHALKFGAQYGKGHGHHGNTYAIPTKGMFMDVLQLETIARYVATFLEYAFSHPEYTFLVIEIGCGLAGYLPEDIAPMFINAEALPNVRLPQSFLNVLCAARIL